LSKTKSGVIEKEESMAKKETVLSVVQELRHLFKETIKNLPRVIATTEPVCSKGGRFIRNADGTVTDKQLNLTWYPTLPKKMTWKEAKKECEKLSCRLPTTHELFSLADVNKYEPAIDKEIFPDTKTDDYYWTQDTCPWNAGLARIVYFYNGYVYSNDKGNGSCVRPVLR